MDGKSHDIASDKIQRLKEVFPEAFCEGKIDFEKLKIILGEEANFENERYTLNWAGKSDAFRVLQQRTPATLKPVPDESYPPASSPEEFLNNNSGNIFIEGENLEVLKILQKSYFSKIKMIYIDPPYNTGNDSFIYPDKFSETKEEYLKRIGDLSDDGYLLKEGFFRKNSRESGRYHSNWLSMMYPRLYIARNLLRDDGVIFVSIDDNEVHNLRMIMNEIFGEENFVANIIWEKRFTRSNNAKLFTTLTEHILLYRKSDEIEVLKAPRNEKSDSIYSNPDNDKRGDWTSVSYVNPATKEQRPNLVYEIENPYTKEKIIHPTNAWKYERSTYLKHLEENRLYWGQAGKNQYPRLKKFLSEMEGGMVPVNLWRYEDTGTTDQGSKLLDNLFKKKIFDFPKPPSLIIKMLAHVTDTHNQNIILDFFAGSGTTAQAVLELNKEDEGNRKFILVQLPEKTAGDSEAYKAGYKTIADISKERIRRVIKKCNNQGNLYSENHVGFCSFKLSPSNFKHWRNDIIESADDIKEMLDLFDTQVKPGALELNILYELMLKSGRRLTDSIEQKSSWYLVEGTLAVVLNKIDQSIIDEIINIKPQTCIILDKVFAGNDQLKTNTALQMKDAGVEMVVV